MMRRWLTLFAGVVLSSAACARSGGEDVEPAARPSASVEVRNDNALPVELFAAGSGTSQRLGTVHPGMRGGFAVPPSMLGGGSVEVQVRSANGQTFRSGPLLLSPGAVVDVFVATQLFNSTATVRP
jgi:hypothetical protein